MTALGLYIAFYYGLTAFSCVWYYRKALTRARVTCGCAASCPLLGGLIMYAAGGYALWEDWVSAPATATLR